jgi:hypothetical protein
MIQRGTQTFILACLSATASILGCIAISVATMPHTQIATPRFYAQKVAISPVHSPYASSGSTVVISR